MRVRASLVCATILVALAVMCVVSPVLAQTGTLKVHTAPDQAYVFVDGQAMHEASRGDFNLSPGNHTVDIYNYGYKPATRKVCIKAGCTTQLDVALEPVPGNVCGPWGCLTINGADRDAVLLNGKTPAFFVGHGDEFDNDWVWKQELVVPPGKYQVTIFEGAKEAWSGAVEVPANQRVIIDVPKGVRKTVSWPRGEQLKCLARFRAGIASTTVAVAKPTAEITASKALINCGETAQLNWKTTDAPLVNISGIGQVPESGEKAVQLSGNTTYTLTATGPGGTATASVPVALNTAMQAELSASPAEARYRRIGDKVIEQPTATLTWSASNVSSVSLDPLGSVDASGSRTLTLSPQKTTPGPVDETLTYTLKATNCSGASEARTATVHLTGSIEETPAEVKKLEARLALHSVFFPTDQPRPERLNAGLVVSQEKILTTLAADFKKYLEFKPDAHLILSGHADMRGTSEYNMALSERRVARTKQFLVEKGVSEASIETRSFGKQEDLSADQVKEMVEQNPDLSAAERQKVLGHLDVIVLAQNRRVDVTLSTTGEKSIRQFPFNAADSLTLLDRMNPGAGKKAAATAKPKGKTQ